MSCENMLCCPLAKENKIYVCPSVRPFICPSVRSSVRTSVCFSVCPEFKVFAKVSYLVLSERSPLYNYQSYNVSFMYFCLKYNMFLTSWFLELKNADFISKIFRNNVVFANCSNLQYSICVSFVKNGF